MQGQTFSVLNKKGLTESQNSIALSFSQKAIGQINYFESTDVFIQLNSISIDLGELYFEFSGEAKFIKHKDYFSWEGYDQKLKAHVELYCDEGLIYGALYFNSKVFQVKAIDESVFAIYESLRTAEEYDCVGLNHNLPTEDPGKEESYARAGNGECFVRVMVAYTNDVDLAGRDFHAIAKARILQMNTILNNSAINHEVELCRVYDFDFDEPAGATHADLVTTFRDHPDLQFQRNLYDADVVVVIVSFGSGRAVDIGVSSGDAYCTVSWANFDDADTKTFAHEIGHLYGAKHNTQAHDNYPIDDSHGYNALINIGEDWRTVMSYRHACNCDRINYFSNPNVDYPRTGSPTGEDPNVHDAAGMIEGRGGDMADFRTCDLNKILTSDDLANQDDYAYLYGHSTLRTTGNYNVRNGAHLDMRASNNVDLYNGLTIHNGAQLRIYLGSCGSNIPGRIIQEENGNPISENQGHSNHLRSGTKEVFVNALRVMPNPIREEAFIRFELTDPSPVYIHINDSNGKVLLNLVNGTLYDQGPHSLSISGKDFPNGMYYVNI
ncbi:MAG: reprolysin-like metallopeptidase, partial [Bacteroidota bacterium]